jgi:hypothetical protein
MRMTMHNGAYFESVNGLCKARAPQEGKVGEVHPLHWSLVHDHPTLKAGFSCAGFSCNGGTYDLATFKELEGQPNWTMEWNTDDQLAKAAFERIVRSVQTQIELK